MLSLVVIHCSDMSIIQKCLINQLAADEIIIVTYCPTLILLAYVRGSEATMYEAFGEFICSEYL